MIEYVEQKQIARIIGVAESTIIRWKQNGDLPTPDARIGTKDVWLPGTIKQWAKTL